MGNKGKKVLSIAFLLFHTCFFSSMGSDITIKTENVTLENGKSQEKFFKENYEDIKKYIKDNQVTKTSLIHNGFFSSIGIFLLNIIFLLNERRKRAEEVANSKKSNWYKTLIINEYLDKIRCFFKSCKDLGEGPFSSPRQVNNDLREKGNFSKQLYSDTKIFDEGFAEKIQSIFLNMQDMNAKFLYDEIPYKEHQTSVEENERKLLSILYDFDMKI